ncbi:MAG: hypothetical protein CO096_02800 [Armatimonadetes bacterium CG_4_9_14_3_um_filter_66_14]|nr:MAG: hypothetical protein CO096_02800 [Armatimonadetes bacterium CG_4_9_14_3_um_filter_66_14]
MQAGSSQHAAPRFALRTSRHARLKAAPATMIPTRSWSLFILGHSLYPSPSSLPPWYSAVAINQASVVV